MVLPEHTCLGHYLILSTGSLYLTHTYSQDGFLVFPTPEKVTFYTLWVVSVEADSIQLARVSSELFKKLSAEPVLDFWWHITVCLYT